MSTKISRIEWEELREIPGGGKETFSIIAERGEGNPFDWVFYEKSSWDVLWIRIPATLARLAKVLTIDDSQQTPTTTDVGKISAEGDR